MELRWPRAYGPAKRRRSDGGATPCSKRLAVVLGSTGIVHAAPIDAPRGYAISRRPLPPWPEALSPGVSRGQFDHADHEVLAMAIAPLADITDVFCIAWHPRPAHAALPPGLCRGRFDLVADALAPFTDITNVAWEPRPTHAAPRGANHTTMLCNVPNCSKRFQLLVLDPFEPFGRIHLTLQRGSETRPGSPLASEGFSDPSGAELVCNNVSDEVEPDHCDWFGKSCFEAQSGSADRSVVTQFLQAHLMDYATKKLHYGRPLKERGVDTRNIVFPEDIHGLDKMVKSLDRFSISGRQAQCLTVLVILGFFIPIVKADAGRMCPLQSINNFLPKTPRTTCPVIKLSGVHWLHSKTTRKTYIHGDIKDNYLIQCFLENNCTKCSRFQDILFVLGFFLLCPVLCQLDQQKKVRFFSYDRTVICLWVDTSLASIVYYACWSLYGSLLSLSKDDEVKHVGLHIQSINFGGCLMFAALLLLLLARHAKDCQFILHRLVGLFSLLLPLYCLSHMNPSNDDIFIIGLIGFSAMVPMYVLKWFTIVGFKGPTTVLNIATILLWLCCVRAEIIRSWYGYAQMGNILFRAIDVTRSICFITPAERAGIWASMRASMKGWWRLVAVRVRRTIATVKRKLRPRGAL